ncbi:unnamed protein product [Ectocarpus sp. 4 AP-2014]
MRVVPTRSDPAEGLGEQQERPPFHCSVRWQAESSGNRVGPQRTDPASLVAGKQPAGSVGCTAVEKEGGDDRPSTLPSGHGITKNRDGCGGGMSESRSLKGAAPDEKNSSAAAKLRERLGRDQP